MPVASSSDLEAAVKDLIDRDAVTIPPYPGVAMRLQQLVAGANYGMSDLAKVAMTDPVVTGFLLRAANSAFYRGASQVTSVSDAVTRIGGADVVRIAIAASLGAEAGRKGALAALRRRIWQESLTSAVVSFQLANARRLNGQEGFVCGLLHDIGRVVAVSCIEALLAQKKDDRSLPESEWLAFVDRFHVQCGMMTAKKWTLSELLKAVIGAHHGAEFIAAHKPMIDVVRASDQVVALILEGPAVTLDMLTAIPDLTPAEAAVLLAAIPAIGPFVASMDEGGTAAAPNAVPSQVAAAPERPLEQMGKLEFPATILRANGQVDGRCHRVMRGGLMFLSKERLQAKYLLKLQLRPPVCPAFEVHASVEACRSDPEGFEIELKLFALAGAARDHWQAVLEASGLVTAPPAADGSRAAVRG